ncbi:kinase-like domain, phloem protein 2-like protein [Tanacetum coccineum]
MLSISHCLISRDGFYYSHLHSRFPSWIYKTNYKGFKEHVRTQFLTPSIRYTVNLILHKGDYDREKQKYVGLRYKLVGETETSIVHLANETKDNRSFIAELYQFTSNGSIFDLEVVILDHDIDLAVEGILFLPLEKVEHEQVYEELSKDSLQWAMKEEDLGTKLLKWFHVDNGQEVYAVDNNGKKSLMFSARGAIRSEKLSFMSSPESRFLEVAVITASNFKIVKIFESDLLSPETTYAIYLVYKSTEDQAVLKNLRSTSYIYLVSPPETPIIGQKLDQNTHSPLNRPKLDAVPRQRSDSWMEVKLQQFQTRRTTGTIDMDICLGAPDYKNICGLIIESIELRPVSLGQGSLDSEYQEF